MPLNGYPIILQKPNKSVLMVSILVKKNLIIEFSLKDYIIFSKNMNKTELRRYFTEDLKRFNNKKPSIKDYILHNEVWYIFHYIKHLRYIEYYKDKSKLLFYGISSNTSI